MSHSFVWVFHSLICLDFFHKLMVGDNFISNPWIFHYDFHNIAMDISLCFS